jgi:hypothetical protein
MKVSSAVLENAKTFIYQNGRLLDRLRYEYFFENGSQEAVLTLLRAYQNADGGFGNALEPDIRCPQSQPVPTEMALAIMDDINAFDPAIIKGIARYLQQIAVLETGGFPFVFRTARNYPHAPWWNTERDDIASINPTGNIVGLLLKQKAWTDFYEEEWFKRTLHYIVRYFDREEPEGYHDGIQWITFLEVVTDLLDTNDSVTDHSEGKRVAGEYVDRDELKTYRQRIDDWLSRPGTIERNPRAEGYVHTVLDWAPQRDSYAAQFINEDELEEHLSHMIKSQQDDGGWLINWPAVSQACELEWRGWVTVERLKTLRSYGWL